MTAPDQTNSVIDPVETSPLRRLFSLFGHSLGTSFDVGLLVAGTGLLGLAFTVLLDGFEVIDGALTDSTGAMLGSGLVIAVFGAFALGVAVEGPIGYASRRRSGYSDLEVAIAGAFSAVIVGVILFTVAGYLDRFTTDLPLPFSYAVTMVRASGSAGMTAALFVGIPALWGARELWGHSPWVEEVELPILYVIWAVGAAIFVLRAI